MDNSTVYRYSVHRDCVNFQNGLCTLSGVAVDPYGAAARAHLKSRLVATTLCFSSIIFYTYLRSPAIFLPFSVSIHPL
jgi:hypothetical protein